MHRYGTLVLVVVGLIHLLPVAGVLGAERLHALYGVRVDDPDLAILLRHRAWMFAILGVLMLAGAAHAPWRMLAMAVGLVSMTGFIVIALLEGGGNAAQARVLCIDVVATLALLVAVGHDALRHFQELR